MAHRKATGTTENVRDSQAQRLGIKIFGGEKVTSGNIIVRQRGVAFHAGNGVKMGKDNTIFAITPGFVDFKKKKVKNFTGNLVKRTFVNVTQRKN